MNAVMKRFLISVTLIGLFGTCLSFAEDKSDEQTQIAGDVEYGEYLSSECVSCHLLSGETEGIPSITGWDPEGFVAVVNAYKNKELENRAMQTIAGRLDDEMIGSLAQYFGSLPAPE